MAFRASNFKVFVFVKWCQKPIEKIDGVAWNKSKELILKAV